MVLIDNKNQTMYDAVVNTLSSADRVDIEVAFFNYMGFVKEELAENGQRVRGIIIALEDDLRLRLALSVSQDIDLYTHRVNFKQIKN